VRLRSWFSPSPSGVAVRLPRHIRETVGDLAEAVLAMLPAAGDPLFPPAVAPAVEQDPALRRLFPDGYDAGAHGGAAADEFRRLTHSDLRAGKAADAERVRATVAASAFDVPTAEAWTRCLNDVRLVLAARLGLRVDGDAERLTERGEGGPALPLYGLLGFVQDELLEALEAGGH